MKKIPTHGRATLTVTNKLFQVPSATPRIQQKLYHIIINVSHSIGPGPVGLMVPVLAGLWSAGRSQGSQAMLCPSLLSSPSRGVQLLSLFDECEWQCWKSEAEGGAIEQDFSRTSTQVSLPESQYWKSLQSQP